jgi:hypothetical protein
MNRGHKNYGIAPIKKSGHGVSQGLYLIMAENDLVKIGITQDIYSRFSILRGNSPLKLEIILWCDAGWAEKTFHERLRDKWSHGEWYALTSQDIDWIFSVLNIERSLMDIEHPIKIDRALFKTLIKV